MSRKVIPDISNEEKKSIRQYTLSGSKDEIRVINFNSLRNFKQFPRYPDNANICENIESIDWSKNFLVFISHCWLRGRPGTDGYDGKPHPDNAKHEKFSLILEAIQKIWGTYCRGLDGCYLWIDFGCINQEGDPAGELRQLDKIIMCSDCLLTIVVDEQWQTWDTTVSDALHDYKATSFQEGYINRAWCRVEMLYAAWVPLRKHNNELRIKKFSFGMRARLEDERRAHMLYGTRESSKNFWPIFLSPLANSFLNTLSPETGNLSYEADREKIHMLYNELIPYIDSRTTNFGYFGSLCSESKLRSGKGKLVLPSGFRYDGDWVSGNCHGKGRITWPDGNTYEGDIQNNHITGYGAFASSNGMVQSGTFESGTLNGASVIEYSTGLKYVGDVVEGELTGNGCVTFPSGVVFFRGKFKNGSPQLDTCQGVLYLIRFIAFASINACIYAIDTKQLNPQQIKEKLNWMLLGTGVLNKVTCGLLQKTKVKGGGFFSYRVPDLSRCLDESTDSHESLREKDASLY